MQHLRLRPIGLVATQSVCALVLCLLGEVAHAGEYSRFGPYVSVSGVYALPLFESDLEDAAQDLLPTVEVSVEDSPGLNARLGLRVATFLAIEAQYEWITGFDTSTNLPGVGTIMSFQAHNITGNLRFHVPIWRVDPYILGGLGATFWKIADESSFPFPPDDLDGTGFAGRVGGGIDFYLTKHIVVNAEVSAVLTTRTFEVPNAVREIDNLYYLSISAGLVYRF